MAHKMTEYCRESENLTICHVGAHKCPLKLDTNKHSKQVRDVVLRNSGLGTCGIQQAAVSQACDSPTLTQGLRRLKLPMKRIKTKTL